MIRQQLSGLLLLLLLLFTVIGCEPEDPEINLPEKKDHWETFSLEDAQVYSYPSYGVYFGQNDQLYAIQPFFPSGRVVCHCLLESGDWQHFTIDSGSSSQNYTFVVKEEPDESIWVLNDTRLIQITDCGVFQSYPVADGDTLSTNDFNDKFVDLEIIDGTPWLLHVEWGVFRYDLVNSILEHMPIMDPGPYYSDISELGTYNSMAVLEDKVWVVNNDGRGWWYDPNFGWLSLQFFGCEDCEFRNLKNDPLGNAYADERQSDGTTITYKFPNLESIPRLALAQSPDYFTRSVFDKTGALAFYSHAPYYQPFIGLQPQGSDVKIVNSLHGVDGGNAKVYGINFNEANDLFVSTDQGILKYIGTDE